MHINIFFDFLIIVSLIGISVMKNVNNFGPYQVVCKKYEICNGPRGRNLTNLYLDLSVNRTSAIFHENYLTNTHIDEMKVVVSKLSDGNIKVLWTYKLKDPCKHLAAAALINTYYKAPDCTVKKGAYSSFVDFDESAKMFFGQKFFYGSYLLKTTVLSKQGNIMCLKLFNDFEKRD